MKACILSCFTVTAMSFSHTMTSMSFCCAMTSISSCRVRKPDQQHTALLDTLKSSHLLCHAEAHFHGACVQANAFHRRH